MVKYSSSKGVVISECPIQLVQSLNVAFRNVVFTLNWLCPSANDFDDVEGDYDDCVVLIGLTLFAGKGAISNSCLFEVKLEEISLNVFFYWADLFCLIPAKIK